jgi:hypothetical protein
MLKIKKERDYDRSTPYDPGMYRNAHLQERQLTSPITNNAIRRSAGGTNFGNRGIKTEPPTPTDVCPTQQPVYFFYECETTGLGPLTTDIIEMAAVVDGTSNTFSSLISTDQQMNGE